MHSKHLENSSAKPVSVRVCVCVCVCVCVSVRVCVCVLCTCCGDISHLQSHKVSGFLPAEVYKCKNEILCFNGCQVKMGENLINPISQTRQQLPQQPSQGQFSV